ncbi:hypothetical protein J3E69DRAFT_378243 [Trichoderma sp. SZMC 28015]
MKGLILITGGTGFVGSHIIQHALDAGFPVRAVARPGKASVIHAMNPNTPGLEVVEVIDLADGDFTDALKGVEAVIHCAAPSFADPTTPSMVVWKGAYDGTVHLIEQSLKAGIKKFIYTGTFMNLFGDNGKSAFGAELVGPSDWNMIKQEDVYMKDDNPAGPVMAYLGAKVLAERKMWEFAEANPQVDFTSVIPSGIYGPFANNFPRPSNIPGLSTNQFIYMLLNGGPEGPNTYPPIFVGHTVDVRDVAKVHILALSADPLPNKQQKRFILSEGVHKWPEVADMVRKRRPELAPRMPGKDAIPPTQTEAPLDTSLAQKLLGFEYRQWEEMFLTGIDECLKWDAGRV